MSPPATHPSSPLTTRGPRVTVIGYDGGPLQPRAIEALGSATLVVGTERLLTCLPVPSGTRRVGTRPLSLALEQITAHDGPVVVLASGDPGLFGITRTLRALGVPIEVLPGVSAVGLLAARLGEAWDDAVVVSAHGRNPVPAANAARALPAVYVLTGPAYGPERLAADLQGWPRRLVVGERLGHPDEAVTSCTLEQAQARTWREPATVLVVDDARRATTRRLLGDNQPAAAPEEFAVDEQRLAHRGSMVTKWEVRAAALSRLGATLGRLVWDIGAGSGSVGLECAAMHAAVVAVDSDPAACATIRHNAARRGLDVRVVHGRAPEALVDLPRPDAVFLGGGGLVVLDAVLGRGCPRVVATYAALDRMVQARSRMIAAGYQVEGVELSSARLVPLPDGGVRLVATNPVVLLSARLGAPEPTGQDR
ncbi:MAG: precorrin-6y C5,15-methyltransferase (decarboxylating) subunit CbiE [Actinomycetes bacterium]